MIGGWNESGCLLSLAPAAWKLGNGTVDVSSGYIPTYPSANKAMSLGATGAGYGYLAATGKLNFDGVNDYGLISNTQQLWHSGTPFSVESILRVQITSNNGEGLVAFSDFGGALPFRAMFIGDELSGYLGLILICGPAADSQAKFGYGNQASFHNLKQHIVITYNGSGVNTIGNWALYINGSAVSLTTYAAASGTLDDYNLISLSPPTNFPGQNEIWWLAVYDEALSPARVAANYALGDSMGLKGNNVGNLMNLTAQVKSGFPYPMFMKGA
jgi:hypothetical protein